MSANLNQVSAIFNDCLEVIRNQQYDGLEKDALEWLKTTRYDLMRQIESEYWDLSRSVNTPSALSAWALDPALPLHIYTRKHKPYLRPYHAAIADNLAALLKSCGFHSRVLHIPGNSEDFYACSIFFPSRLTNNRTSSTLDVADEFSGDMGDGFARLLTRTDEKSKPTC